MLHSLYPKTLFGKLVLTQIAFALVAATSFFLVLEATHSRYHLEIGQKQSIDLAQRLLREQQEILRTDARGAKLIQSVLAMHRFMGAGLDYYWLDSTGRVVAASRSSAELLRDTVDIAPLLKLLSRPESVPVLAADPTSASESRIFSVAAIGDLRKPEAFFYVVLQGLEETQSPKLRGAYSFWESAALVAGAVALAFGTSVLILVVVLRPFRRLSGAVDRFCRSDFTRWPPQDIIKSNPEGGELDRLTSHFNDMAGRLADLLHQLKDDDRRMREMFAVISHDLRTPLTIIQGYIETLHLKGAKLPAAEREQLLAIASSEAQSLGRLIESVFELAKLESPNYRLEREPFSLAEAVNDVAVKFALRAKEKGFDIQVRGKGGRAMVQADIALIERVFDNLIENAIKYATGGNRIVIEFAEESDEVEVSISDNGSGLPEPYRGRLMTDSYSPVAHTGRKSPGSGLGLAIVQRILELHGTVLRADRGPEGGARFTFRLPFAQRAEANSKDPANVNVAPANDRAEPG